MTDIQPITQRLVAAFRAVAGWPASHDDARDDPGLPVIVAHTRLSAPAVVLVEQLARQTGRDAVLVQAELRGRRPRFSAAVAQTGADASDVVAQGTFSPWLSLDGGLWLVSAYWPHPDLPFFRLAAHGLVPGETLPWPDRHDRELGQEQAYLVFARQLGKLA